MDLKQLDRDSKWFTPTTRGYIEALELRKKGFRDLIYLLSAGSFKVGEFKTKVVVNLWEGSNAVKNLFWRSKLGYRFLCISITAIAITTAITPTTTRTVPSCILGVVWVVGVGDELGKYVDIDVVAVVGVVVDVTVVLLTGVVVGLGGVVAVGEVIVVVRGVVVGNIVVVIAVVVMVVVVVVTGVVVVVGDVVVA